jgi:AraC-like DNA-binding protein
MAMTASIATGLQSAAYFAASLQSLFLLIYLLSRRTQRTSETVALAGAVAAFCLSMVDDFLGSVNFYDSLPPIAPLFGNLLPSLIGPFLYLHMEGLATGKEWRFQRRHAVHFLVFFALCIPMLLAAFDPLQLVVLTIAAAAPVVVTPIQGAVYLWLLIGLARKRDLPGDDGALRAAWLRVLLYSAAGLLALYIGGTILPLVLGGGPSLGPFLALAYATLLYAFSWASLQHGPVFQHTPASLMRELVAPLTKYRKSAQTAEDAQRIVGKVEAIIARDLLYRDSALTLPGLAEAVGTSPNALSQAINQYLGLNYFDFINRYRVEEAKKLLKESPDGQTTILDIAFCVGFNSKSTFNTAFKRLTGVTPSAFRDESGSSL